MFLIDFKIRTREHKGTTFYGDEDKKVAKKFAKAVDKELKDFLKAAVLFGSASKHKRKDRSDIDVLLIIDDADVVVTPEMTEAYRLIVKKAALEVSLKIHINTMKLTSFWEKSREGDPVLINILRDGIPLIDKGFFRATQALLDQGRIRPTKESVWIYYARSPVSIRNSQKHVMQACVDLYWAGIDAAHAALMSVGAMPPSPEHVPDLMQTHLVEKGWIHKKYPVIMKELYDLSKHIEHRDVKMVSGAQYDAYLKETETLVRELRTVVKENQK